MHETFTICATLRYFTICNKRNVGDLVEIGRQGIMQLRVLVYGGKDLDTLQDSNEALYSWR